MTNYNPNYFYNDGECKEHSTNNCRFCLAYSKQQKVKVAKVRKSQEVSAITLVDPERTKELSYGDKTEAIEKFNNSVEFVREALNFTEEGISKKRVAELPELLERAKNEITIGKMKKLNQKEETEIKEMGMVGKLFFSPNFWKVVAIIFIVVLGILKFIKLS